MDYELYVPYFIAKSMFLAGQFPWEISMSLKL